MTEAEWNESSDPTGLLNFLRERGTASDRKLRLFVVACCRRLMATALTASALRKAVEVGERFADGLAAEWELAEARDELRAVEGLGISKQKVGVARRAAWLPTDCVAVHLGGAHQALAAALGARIAEALHAGATDPQAVRALNAALCRVQADLLRDILGPLPFREARTGPSLLMCSHGLVPKLAQAAYDDRHLPEGTLDSGRLVVLADALEEAGLADKEIVCHLRRQGLHVRGCWVIDLLLGKE